IGVKGEYSKARSIKDQVTQWLEQDLKLTISKNKSKIVKASKGCTSMIQFCRSAENSLHISG
ncbi:MAG: hypothetical protein Q8807_03605, partial ['Waltheria sp.' little leaf phytoplasma]|nr:hypothetical protein ['Waltheria sp.' little leaf phytoplasma]